jgi:hypothetical protein
MYLWQCYPAVLNIEVHVQKYRKKVDKESIIHTVLNQHTLYKTTALVYLDQL